MNPVYLIAASLFFATAPEGSEPSGEPATDSVAPEPSKPATAPATDTDSAAPEPSKPATAPATDTDSAATESSESATAPVETEAATEPLEESKVDESATESTSEVASDETTATETTTETTDAVVEPSPPEMDPTSQPTEQLSADAEVTGSISLAGTYLVSMTRLSDLRLDVSGDGEVNNDELYGQNMLVLHRLRFHPTAKLHRTFTLYADLQLAAGLLAHSGPNDRFAGFGPPRGDDGEAFDSYEDEIKLRKLYFEWRSSIGAVLAGRMASNWGLGILANSGDNDFQDWGGARFGVDRNFGDIVNRVVFATQPFTYGTEEAWGRKWTLALGADVVERDERVLDSAGDFAWEAIGALRYNHDKEREAGVYVAYRNLEDRNDDTLEVVALDLFGKGSWRFGDFEVSGAGEVAYVSGTTTWGAAVGIDALDVGQLGYVARVGGTYLPFAAGADIEVGYASGDSNPYDQYSRGFTFDPDYNPSLILFEELRAAETVAATANASDPARVAFPARSVRLLPTNGSVTNTIYIRPTLRSRWNNLVPEAWGEIETRVALLWAMAEEDVVDPFLLNLTSENRNHQGGFGSEHSLGVELDVGVDYTYTFESYATLRAGLQYGHLFVGKGFDNAAGESHPGIDLFFARLAVTWLPEEQQ